MRRRMMLATAIIAAVGVVTLIAFTVVRASAGPTVLTDHSWTLTRLVVNGQEQPLSETHPATLRFQSQTHNISGGGGCNSYGASYVIAGNTLHISDIRLTLMACMDTRVMEQEASYLQALGHVESYHLTGDTLTLESDSGHIVMTFSPAKDTGQ